MTSMKDPFSYLVYIITGIFVIYCVRYGGKLRMETFPLKIIEVLPGT